MRRRTALATLAAATLAPTHGHAGLSEEPPPPGPPRPLALPEVQPTTLDNGLQLLRVPRPGVPLVTASLFVRAGRSSDPEGRAGLAPLTASLLARGARRDGRDVPATQLVRQAEALGSALEVQTGWQAATLSMTVIPSKLDAALALLADVVSAPLLAAAELDRLRTQTLDALRVSLAEPGAVATMAARRAFWGASPFGASPTPASVARITGEDVAQHHGRWFRPDRSVLVLVGPWATPDPRAALQASFGRWPGRPITPAAPAWGASRPIAANGLVIDLPGSGQAGVVVAAPFVAADSAERGVADVALSLLGGGYSSRLNQAVRIQRGLSYGAMAGAEMHPTGGVVLATTQTSHPNAGLTAEVMREELLRIGREAAPAEELQARKAALIGTFGRGLETTAGVAETLGRFAMQGLGSDAFAAYADRVQAVTPDQVRDFAARHWAEDRLRTVITSDGPAADAAARSLGRGAVRIAQAQLDLESPTLSR